MCTNPSHSLCQYTANLDREALYAAACSAEPTDDDLDTLQCFAEAILSLNTVKCCASPHYCPEIEACLDEVMTTLKSHGVQFDLRIESPRGSCDETYLKCTLGETVIFDECYMHCC